MAGNHLRRVSEANGISYRQLVSHRRPVNSSTCMTEIERDLGRTLPGQRGPNGEEDFFATEVGRNQLKNVLAAYAAHNPTVGYCQSMNFLAAVLLLQIKDEESSFWSLALLVDEVLPHYYHRSLSGLSVDQAVLEEYAQEQIPQVLNKLRSLSFDMALFTTNWLLCECILYPDFHTSVPLEALLVFLRFKIALVGRWRRRCGQALHTCRLPEAGRLAAKVARKHSGGGTWRSVRSSSTLVHSAASCSPRARVRGVLSCFEGFMTGSKTTGVFINSLPWDCVLRILDILLVERDAQVLLRAAAAILKLMQPQIMLCQNQEDLFNLLKSKGPLTLEKGRKIEPGLLAKTVYVDLGPLTNLSQRRAKHATLLRAKQRLLFERCATGVRCACGALRGVGLLRVVRACEATRMQHERQQACTCALHIWFDASPRLPCLCRALAVSRDTSRAELPFQGNVAYCGI
jgi:hypothetical protein